MQNEDAICIQDVKIQTIAGHLRKTARDLALVGMGCGLVAFFWRDTLSDTTAIWLAAAVPLGCSFYAAALFAEHWENMRRR